MQQGKPLVAGWRLWYGWRGRWLRSLLIVGICVGSLGLSPAQKLGYIFKNMGYGIKLMLTRMELAEVMADPEKAELYSTQLKEVAQLKAMAAEYGLRTDTYTHMVFPADDPAVVSYLVTASERLQLAALEEWFPLVGKLNYLGYFSEAARDAKAQELAQHYDVATVRAGAFSLLGYLADPIFPSMLEGSRWAVAELFIHEMVHGTIWIKNAHEFNERLADFLAERISRHYLMSVDDRQELDKKAVYQSDKALYGEWFGRLEAALKQLYSSTLDDAAKLQQKSAIFAEFTANKPAFKRYDFVGQAQRWNNAQVVLNQIYAPDLTVFADLLSCSPKTNETEQLKHVIGVLSRHQKQLDPGSVAEMIHQACQFMAA